MILAGPTRVEKEFAQISRRPLAVLVDRSGSMTKPDHRGQQRLDQALRSWSLLAPVAAATHSRVETFAFAGKLSKTPTVEASSQSVGPSETALFASLQEVMQQAPRGGWAGIVTLTDGLDTSPGDAGSLAEGVMQQAQRAGTPLYFLCGKNLTANETPFLTFRDLTLPVEVPPKSSFTLVLTADSYQTMAHRVPMRVQVGDKWLNGPPLFLNAGRHVALWQLPFSADAPGRLPLVIEAGEGAEKIQLRATVTVANATRTTRVLYFEGALDWARKFLVRILRRDPNFDVSSVVHLRPGVARNSDTMLSTGSRLPDSAEGFKDLDVLVLANAGIELFSVTQQKAVSSWVVSGGTLLFLAPDNRAAADYAGTEFERLLPVVFPPRPTAQAVDPEVSAFRRQMAALGHSNSEAETDFAAYAASVTLVPDLVTFDWEPKAREIFATDGVMPQPLFAGYARVLRAKPGAQVLARHPVDKSPQGDERAILFAMQRYGRGQVAILTCDALWRWKMHEPSEHRAVEQFWQQLFAWLGRQRQREAALHFDHPAVITDVDQTMTLRVSGGGNTGMQMTAAMEGSPAIILPPGEEENGVTAFQWRPPAAGLWSIVAQNSAGEKVTHWVTVRTKSKNPTGELSGLPPDEGLLGLLAARTGGAILETAPPAAWTGDVNEVPKLISEHRIRLWDSGIAFSALLGLYLIELVSRRILKLL
jgi:hypothetical protein